MTPKQRKVAWISAAALAVIYYTPTVVNMAMQSAYQRQAAQRAPASMRALPTPALPAPAPFHYLLGEYSGRAVIAARGICALRFELRDKREKQTGPILRLLYPHLHAALDHATALGAEYGSDAES